MQGLLTNPLLPCCLWPILHFLAPALANHMQPLLLGGLFKPSGWARGLVLEWFCWAPGVFSYLCLGLCLAAVPGEWVVLGASSYTDTPPPTPPPKSSYLKSCGMFVIFHTSGTS